MTSQESNLPHQSNTQLTGAWKLRPGRALTLKPSESGRLRVAGGTLWATGDGPHAGPLNDQGDRILRMGEQMTLRPGERLLIESLDGDRPAYYSWDPAPMVRRRRVETSALVQPLADLRLALALGVTSLGRLLVALIGLAWTRAGRAGRSALAERAFNAHSSACRAHGAMSSGDSNACAGAL